MEGSRALEVYQLRCDCAWHDIASSTLLKSQEFKTPVVSGMHFEQCQYCQCQMSMHVVRNV